jgi:WD40-like Beta Propeller Repeat
MQPHLRYRFRRHAWVAATLAALAWLISCGAPAAAPARDGPPFVMVRGSSLVRGDGEGQFEPQALIEVAGGLPAHPIISPDGRQIALVGLFPPPPGSGLRLPISKLLLISADGGGERVLWEPPQGLIGCVAWSGDGRTLYAGIDGLRAAPLELGGYRLQEIVRIDVATGDVLSLFEEAFDPAISRDGGRMAYMRTGDGSSEERPPVLALEVSTLDGREVRQIVDGGQFVNMAWPRFSPDGQQIIFAGSGGPQVEGQGGRGLLALLDAPAAEAHGLRWDLWAVQIDGSGLRRLAALNEDEPVAAFSPDGSEIVVMGAGGVYRMRADGSGLRKLGGAGDHGGLDWVGR